MLLLRCCCCCCRLLCFVHRPQSVSAAVVAPAEAGAAAGMQTLQGLPGDEYAAALPNLTSLALHFPGKFCAIEARVRVASMLHSARNSSSRSQGCQPCLHAGGLGCGVGFRGGLWLFYIMWPAHVACQCHFSVCSVCRPSSCVPAIVIAAARVPMEYNDVVGSCSAVASILLRWC